jgi:hypothetical protein
MGNGEWLMVNAQFASGILLGCSPFQAAGLEAKSSPSNDLVEKAAGRSRYISNFIASSPWP